MTAQVAADLRAAAEVLRRDGWGQGRFQDEETGCCCVAGALAAAVAPNVEVGAFSDRWRASLDTLADHLGLMPWPTSVYRWNDAPVRTADEVIAALYAAADAAEQQPQSATPA